jgi:hypothetical protein
MRSKRSFILFEMSCLHFCKCSINANMNLT